MRMMESQDYPVVIRATPDRSLMEARRLLESGMSVAVVARSKKRAKCFERLRYDNLVVIDFDIRRADGLHRAAIGMASHFDAIFLLRDTADELSDRAELDEHEVRLLAHHLIGQLIASNAVLTFEAYVGASNVYALHPR